MSGREWMNWVDLPIPERGLRMTENFCSMTTIIACVINGKSLTVFLDPKHILKAGENDTGSKIVRLGRSDWMAETDCDEYTYTLYPPATQY